VNRLASYRHLWHRLKAAWRGHDHEQALRNELHKGIQLGMQHATTTYEQRCGVHHLPLEIITPGRFHCWLCLEIDQQQKQLTGPIKVPTGTMLGLYLKNPKHYATNFRIVALEKPIEK
jgi:hypothetical protein